MMGIVISLISLTMSGLIMAKRSVGKRLNSEAILADANCTKTCLMLSIILLAASALYELTHIGYIDAAGTLGIAWYAFKEGREAMEKSKGKVCCCS